MTLGERIKAKRKLERISAEDLAVKLGLKKENIYKWERGSKPSDPEDFHKINMWLQGITRSENVPHENILNSKTSDHDKYVALLESTNRTLEKSIQLSLNAMLENQRMIQAMLKTAVQNGEDLLADNGRKLEKVKEETNRRNAANFQALSAVHTGVGTSGKD
jgi:transcriptional regulator with XRE-family HTH domain